MAGKLALLLALGLGASGVLSAADVMRGDIVIGSVGAPSLVQAAKSLAEEIAAFNRGASDISRDLQGKLNSALHYCDKVQSSRYGFRDVGLFRKALTDILAVQTDDSLARAVAKVLCYFAQPKL